MQNAVRCTLAVALLALAACATGPEPEPVRDAGLGNFRLGFNVVVVRDALQGPGSQPIDEAALQTAIAEAVVDRLGAYDGDGLYHLGIRVDAYVLAEPGTQSESVLLMAANVWDEASKRNLTAEPLEIAGIAPAGTTNITELAERAALALEDALRANASVWFAPKPDQPRVAFDRTAQQPSAPATVN
ncbi:MAG: hypothetical protein AAFY90_10380 [Pseudomonadota bacterium]